MRTPMMFKLTYLLPLFMLVSRGSCELCSYTPAARVPVQLAVRYGQPLSIKSEFNGIVPFLIRWNKADVDPVTGRVKDNVLVTYVNGTNSWADRNSPRNYAAVYRLENGLTSYELQILRATCDAHGEFSCHFIGTNDCTTEFNITVTADPLPPLIQNRTIRANAGQTVDIVCEANVGNPPGDIWWYHVSKDGGNIRRIYTGFQSNVTIVEGCRSYMTSILTVIAYRKDHDSSYRCRSVKTTAQNLGNFISQARVNINGLEPTICDGIPCGNSAQTFVVSLSTLLAHCLVVSMVFFVL